MQHWKLLGTSLLSFLLILFAPVQVQSDCGPSGRPSLNSYSFLQPILANPLAAATPYFLDFDVLYSEYGRQINNQIEENLLEWQERYCQYAGVDAIYQLVYKASARDLEELLNSINNKKLPLPISLRSNTFAIYLRNNNCKETVQYLIFAKNCEPFVTTYDAWELRAGNEEAMRSLIQQGKREFMSAKSYYVRLRYAYQLIRMAHYLRDYEQTLALYDFLMPKIDNDPSILEYWIEGHRAGALKATGKRVEASYIYSLIFENSKGKRESALNSFSLRSEEEWKACLLLCKTDKERATIYALRAQAEGSKPLEDMKKIYRLDQNSEHLDVLLIKELKRLEKQLLGLEFNPRKRQNKQFYNVPKPGTGEYIIALQGFVREHNKTTPKKSAALWKLAEGYLELLAGDFYHAERTLAKAAEFKVDDKMAEQIEALRLVAKISAYREVNEKVENEVARIKLDDATYQRFPDFRRFIADKMSWLYEDSGEVGKLFLQQHNLSDLRANPQEEVLDALIEIAQKELPNRFERDLIRKPDGSSMLNDLIDIKATYLMGRGELIAAYEVFKQMDNNLWESYGLFNPFEERLLDCINCKNRDSLTLYSKPQIIQRILDYEYQALANREQGAGYFYRIGLAYYNMSYFGYAWNATDYFRSGSSIRNRQRSASGVVPTWQFDYGNQENFSNRIAKEYFDKVILLTNNRELAASATFMAAKCAQNEYFLNGGERDYKYFDLLKGEYKNTLFYQKAIAECKYFATYALR